MKNYLRLNKKNLKKYKIEYGWEGIGNGAHNPIKIDSINKPYTRLKLKQLENYIQISNLTLEFLYLKNCKNIEIKDCRINHLVLTSCRRMILRNNILLSFVLFTSKNNKIIGNQISRLDYHLVKNNQWDHRENKILSLVLCVALILIYYIISYEYLLGLIYFIPIVGVVIYAKILSKVQNKRVSNLPENIFLENVEINLEN